MGVGAGLAATALLASLLVLGVQAGVAVKPSPCDHSSTVFASYHWPVKPFDRQHPVRGAFGDPRTVVPRQLFGRTGPGEVGTYSFHSGIDIVAPPGTPVYPVVSGRVVVGSQDKIVVQTDDCRRFQYYHLAAAVHPGQIVVAEQTILGSITTRFEHVHLGEIDTEPPHERSHIQNPLAPGHLEPYQDRTKPTATGLYLDNGHGPRPFHGRPLRPGDRLAVAAADPPALPVPGHWHSLPQAPALVEWRLVHGRTHTPWQVVADFRKTEPPRQDFWTVYAPGTYQNRPYFDQRLYLGSPGRYLFRIGLNPSHLHPGRYRLQVRVADIRQNHSIASWPLLIPGR